MDQIAKLFAEDYDDDTNHESVPIRVRRTGKYNLDKHLENMVLWTRRLTHVFAELCYCWWREDFGKNLGLKCSILSKTPPADIEIFFRDSGTDHQSDDPERIRFLCSK